MRERHLDEFSSLFQRSIVPTIEVERIRIRDIVVLADFGDGAPRAGEAVRQLADRFGARVSVRFLLHPRDEAHEEEARRLLEAVPGDERRIVHGDPSAHVLDLVEREKPSLIVAPAPFHLFRATPEADALSEFLDGLLVATAIPTLLVRGTLGDPPFGRILVKLPGGRHDLIEQFSFAFALCPPGGTVRLLHVIEEEQLKFLAELLEITPEIDTAGGAGDLLAAVKTRMDNLLRGAIKTGEGAGFHVEASIRTGDPFEIVPREARGFSLLIVGSQSSHREFLQSRAYELIRRVPEIPVLAL